MLPNLFFNLHWSRLHSFGLLHRWLTNHIELFVNEWACSEDCRFVLLHSIDFVSQTFISLTTMNNKKPNNHNANIVRVSNQQPISANIHTECTNKMTLLYLDSCLHCASLTKQMIKSPSSQSCVNSNIRRLPIALRQTLRYATRRIAVALSVGPKLYTNCKRSSIDSIN